MDILLHSLPPTLKQATADPCLCWRLPDTPGQVWFSLFVGSLLLSPGSWCTSFCLCSPRVYFPVLCKFWGLYGGVNGYLLQEGLCHTPSAAPRAPAPAPDLHRTCSKTVVSHSLWGRWVLVCTRFVRDLRQLRSAGVAMRRYTTSKVRSGGWLHWGGHKELSRVQGQGKPRKTVRHWRSCEERPHARGQRRSPTKTVGGPNSTHAYFWQNY